MTSTAETAPKKHKLDDDALIERAFNKSVLAEVAKHHETMSKENALPFPHIRISNVFNEELLEAVKAELIDSQYYRKNNDLYQFLQSKDLRSLKQQKVESVDNDGEDAEDGQGEDGEEQKKQEQDEFVKPNMCLLRDALYSNTFRRFICDICGWDRDELNGTIDMSAACYRDTDYLLCHDDELEGRRIAYIIYFVPKDWSAKDGGSLDLFDVDPETQQPRNIVKSLVPEWNSLAFFQVNPVSHHQVSEVLRDKSKCEDRITIVGWFHGKPIKRPPVYVEPSLPYAVPVGRDQKATVESLPSGSEEELEAFKPSALLKEWINPLYFTRKTLEQVRELFSETSQLELITFLKQEQFDAITKAFKEQAAWKFIGPANRRHYEVVADESTSAAQVLESARKFFASNEFCNFISLVTQYPVLEQHVAVRKFDKGAYTLVHGMDFSEHGLDCFLCVCPDGWDMEHGAVEVYMDETQELLSVPPVPNALNIVLRDAGVMRFTKYVNNHAPEPRYDFFMNFKVPKPEEADDADWEDVEGEEGEEYDQLEEEADQE